MSTKPTDPQSKRKQWANRLIGLLGYATIGTIAWYTIDHQGFWDGVARFRYYHFFLIFGALLMNLATRAYRYHWLVRVSGPSNYHWWDGVRIFLTGVALSAITPARAGDLIKVRLVKPYGISWDTGLGLVVVERILDLLVVTATIPIGVIWLKKEAANQGWITSSLLFLAILVLGVLAVSIKNLRIHLLKFVAIALSKLKKTWHKEKALLRLEGLFVAWDKVFASPSRIIFWIIFSAIAWLFEFSKLALVLVLIGGSFDLAIPLFVYPMSIVAGILTVLPFSEGTLCLTGVALMVTVLKINKNLASVAVVIDRATSVLIPVVLGFIWNLLASRPDTRAHK
ncbi:MAG: lysylphosphatidylglycerol synthase transmembrane domain-containing protein [Pseudomonadota bacterium]